jgi:UDP-N-acetyl-alpha-D-muramoyl-L-alanyl-L-glutamate epimerase
MIDIAARKGRFSYPGYEFNPDSGVLTLRYDNDDEVFEEQYFFGPARRWNDAAAAAARLLYLMAGVSYFKTTAPPILDLGETETSPRERAFLLEFYQRGLGEFAVRNGVDLDGLTLIGPERAATGVAPQALAHPPRPLIPFGGGIDSIVTVESLKGRFNGAALFVLDRRGSRFEAIERSAALTQLPVVRVERQLDPKLTGAPAGRYLNGHVPITGILSAAAVLTAILHGYDAVVMSNEASASAGNLTVDGALVNHQYSKSLDFEVAFREVLDENVGDSPSYFSFLRARSELWVAQRFSALEQYHQVFRSCNRAFHLDPERRAASWCGVCDKCCFIDLVLAPFLGRTQLEAIFDGAEPLANPALSEQFRTLLDMTAATKPFECVGDPDECRSALVLAAARADREDSGLIAELLAELAPDEAAESALARHLSAQGPHFVADAYAPDDQLV